MPQQKQKAAAPAATAKPMDMKLVGALAVVFIIIALVAVYLAVSYFGKPSTPTLQTLSGLSGSAFLEALYTPGNLNSTIAQEAMAQKFNSTPVNVEYNETLNFTSSNGTKVNNTLAIKYMSYKADTFYIYALLSGNRLSSLEEVFHNGQEVHDCSNGISAGSCQLNPQALAFELFLDPGSFKYYIIHVSKVTQLESGGMPCTFIAGSLTLNPPTEAPTDFAVCISNQYYVPLAYIANTTGTSGVSLVDEKFLSIDGNATESDVMFNQSGGTTTQQQNTTTMPSTVQSTASTSTSAATTTMATTTITPTTTAPSGLPSCGSLNVTLTNAYQSKAVKCYWKGGPVSVNYGAGNFAQISFNITGADKKVYIKNATIYSCGTPAGGANLPMQNYTVYVSSAYSISGACASTFVNVTG